MSWVRTFSTSMSQMVHVVSIDAVPTMLSSVRFQSNDVSGAQYSEFLFGFSSDTKFTADESGDTSHSRRKSPVVASRSRRSARPLGAHWMFVVGYGWSNLPFSSNSPVDSSSCTICGAQAAGTRADSTSQTRSAGRPSPQRPYQAPQPPPTTAKQRPGTVRQAHGNFVRVLLHERAHGVAKGVVRPLPHARREPVDHPRCLVRVNLLRVDTGHLSGARCGPGAGDGSVHVGSRRCHGRRRQASSQGSPLWDTSKPCRRFAAARTFADQRKVTNRDNGPSFGIDLCGG